MIDDSPGSGACAHGWRSRWRCSCSRCSASRSSAASGFFAKWYVLQAALQAPAPQTTLAVMLVLTTVVSAGYYLYVVMVMFMRPRAGRRAAIVAVGRTDAGRARRRASSLLLVLGVVPDYLVRISRAGAAQGSHELDTFAPDSPRGALAGRGAPGAPTRQRSLVGAALTAAPSRLRRFQRAR